MALKHFCQACGESTDYVSTVPKFCSCCGQSFVKKTVTAATVSPVPVSRKRRQVIVEEEDEEVEINHGPREYELAAVVEGKPRVVLIDDVIKEPKTGFTRAPGSSPRGEALLQDLRRECANRRIEDAGQ